MPKIVHFYSMILVYYVRQVFKNIRFSEKGTNARIKEQKPYMMFLQYLNGCEKGDNCLVLIIT